MRAFVKGPQPLIGIFVAILAAATIGWSLSFPVSASTNWIMQGIWVSVVGLAFLVAARFPIHIDTHFKVAMNSVALLMAAMLLVPWLAAVTVAGVVGITEIQRRKARGLWLSESVTITSNRVVVVTLGALLNNQTMARGWPLPVIGMLVAVWMFVGDVMTLPLGVARFDQRPALFIMRSVARHAWRPELSQSAIGILAVLMARTAPLATPLLLVPLYLVYMSFRRAYEMRDDTRGLLLNMADLVDDRDAMTAQHSQRVSNLTMLLCRQLGVGPSESELIIAAARVHDVGKISIPDVILHKPGALTTEEWAVMQTHVEIGARMLESNLRGGQQGRRLAEIVRGHHERWDGKGYPSQTAGAKISLGGRIIAVADSFDAMSSNRSYRSRLTELQILTILKQGRGTQWDPAVVDAFFTMMSKENSVAVREEQIPAMMVHHFTT
ncbi:MAG: hypothetical protein NVS4B8_30000 [Herpetosiphon sp.]